MQQFMGMMLLQQMNQQAPGQGGNPLAAMMGQMGAGAGSGAGGPQGGNRGVIQVTQQEKAAIDRLKAMCNVSEHRAVEAYMVCGKNEEMAANYLFDNPDFGSLGTGGGAGGGFVAPLQPTQPAQPTQPSQPSQNAQSQQPAQNAQPQNNASDNNASSGDNNQSGSGAGGGAGSGSGSGSGDNNSGGASGSSE